MLEILPQIIWYIAIGYILLKTFHFVALKQNTLNLEHILTASLVVGFIFCNIMYLIPCSINQLVDHIIIILFAVIIGYFSGRVLNSRFAIDILDKLKIRDTPNLYFWDDILDNNYPMKIQVLHNNKKYEGMLHNYESYSNNPHIVLASYIIKNINDEIIEDHSKSKNSLIVLDTSNTDDIAIFYDNRSNKCDDIIKLCKNNNKKYY